MLIQSQGRRRKVFVLVGMMLVLLLQALGTRPPSVQGRGKRQECSQAGDFRAVRGQGRACRTRRGHWKVLLRNGSIVESHGPDPVTATAGHARRQRGASQPGVLASAATPACVQDLAGDYYSQVLYAYSADQPNGYASQEPAIRESVQIALDMLQLDAAATGVTASFKLACDTAGRVRVDQVRLATPYESSDFGTILSDLVAQGYANPRVKYWVWFDGAPPLVAGFCGQGGIWGDETGAESNTNNGNSGQAGYGISYGCGGSVLLHEAIHTMGGVQLGTPNASGGWHCNDDQDVMCYPDGGARASEFRWDVCADREHLDCNLDDYFNPSPTPDSYLATHWNLGACYNRFIQRSGCGAQPAVLKVQYKTWRGTTTTNDVSAVFQLLNGGASAVPLHELTLRYWFTADAASPSQSFNCDWAQIGCANVAGSIVALSSPRSGADHYLQIGFISGAGQLGASSGGGEIQTRFHKSDWSNYTQTNDYSFDGSKTSLADWPRVTLYRQGTLIWGAEP